MLIFSIRDLLSPREAKSRQRLHQLVLNRLLQLGPSVGSPVSLPSFADDDRLKEAVLSALQTLSKKGSLGTNPFSFAAPFPVPDSDSPKRQSSGGDGCPEPHNVGGVTRSSALGACEVIATDSSTPYVKSHMYPSMSVSYRSDQFYVKWP